jgi:hypothetical protein
MPLAVSVWFSDGSKRKLGAKSYQLKVQQGPGGSVLRTRKPAVIRSQEKKWLVIPEQSAAFAVAKAPSSF